MGVKYQIIIEIDADDNVTMETKGFKGPSCMEELSDVTKNIGEIKSHSKTKEYYEQVKQKIKRKIGSFSK